MRIISRSYHTLSTSTTMSRGRSSSSSSRIMMNGNLFVAVSSILLLVVVFMANLGYVDSSTSASPSEAPTVEFRTEICSRSKNDLFCDYTCEGITCDVEISSGRINNNVCYECCSLTHNIFCHLNCDKEAEECLESWVENGSIPGGRWKTTAHGAEYNQQHSMGLGQPS